MELHNYREEHNKKLKLKIQKLTEEMPDFAKLFFRNMENKNASVNTIASYAYDIRLFFSFLMASAGFRGKDLHTLPVESLDLLQPEDIEEYISHLSIYSDRDGNTRTNEECGKARKVASLRSFYNYYYKKGMIKTNPAILIDTPTLHTKEIIRMDKDEVADLLSCVRSGSGLTVSQLKYYEKTRLRDIALLTTLLGTGLRVSECVGLDLDDIDFKNGCLHVIRKGGNEAKVYFGIEVEEALMEYIEDERSMLQPKDSDTTALFLSLQQTRITVRSVEALVKKYARAAGISKHITPHKCRSTYGTNLYSETGDIYLVANALGHSSVETTKKHYAAMEEQRQRKAAKASSSLFNND